MGRQSPRRQALRLVLTAAAVALPAAGAGVPVELAAPDGTKLAATSFEAGTPGPGVLLLHMCNSDRSAWDGLGAKLAAAGIHALALDYRSYGASGGEAPEGFGAERQRWIDEKWPGDVDTAFEYLASRPGVDRDRIGAAGGSCGVNQAVHFARRHPDQVRTLALLAGNANRAGEDYLAANGWMPLLGVASRDDGNAVEMMAWTIGFSGHPANRIETYERGGHGTELFAVHADLEPKIVGWFEEHLLRHPARRGTAAPALPRPPSLAIRGELHAPGAPAGVPARFAADRRLALPPEAVINSIGYQLLQEGRLEDAIETFRLNVDAHPESANTYDSLGDAYLQAGREELAREMARATLERLPGDPNQGDAFQRALRDAAEAKLRPPAADTPPRPPGE